MMLVENDMTQYKDVKTITVEEYLVLLQQKVKEKESGNRENNR